MSCPAICADGAIYFGCLDGYLYALTDNGTSATMKWRYAAGSSRVIYSAPAIRANGTIYVGFWYNDTATFYALTYSGTSATVKWSFAAVNNTEYSSPAVGLTAGSTSAREGSAGWSRRHYRQLTSGTVDWTYTFPNDDEIDSSPLIGANGTIYVGSNTNDTAYAFTDNSSPPRCCGLMPREMKSPLHWRLARPVRCTSGQTMIVSTPSRIPRRPFFVHTDQRALRDGGHHYRHQLPRYHRGHLRRHGGDLLYRGEQY